MVFTILLALTGLILSAVAIYYSVLGLTAIFAAAFWPIVVMGTTLEVAKLVAASWLKARWSQIPGFMKTYMIVSVAVLMLITSMGIFGFLSKAHSDQNLVSGDVVSRISLIDEKIKIERENIANAQAVIKQMDAAVNGVMATGDQEVKLRDGSTQIKSAAERSLQIRRSQAKDRDKLTKEIDAAQKRIVALQEESAPIRAEMRKVEAEVGPIKYIAAFIYGDNPDTNVLEKAVTWVIVTIIFVFDPLAILLLLGSQMTYQWWKQEREVDHGKEHLEEMADVLNEVFADELENDKKTPEEIMEKPQASEPEHDLDLWNKMVEEAEKAAKEEKVAIEADINPDELDDVSNTEKMAMKLWKEESPENNLKKARTQFERGLIKELPWLKYIQEDLKARADEITEDQAAAEAIAWAKEQEESKKKKPYIVMEQDHQVKKTREE